MTDLDRNNANKKDYASICSFVLVLLTYNWCVYSALYIHDHCQYFITLTM